MSFLSSLHFSSFVVSLLFVGFPLTGFAMLSFVFFGSLLADVFVVSFDVVEAVSASFLSLWISRLDFLRSSFLIFSISSSTSLSLDSSFTGSFTDLSGVSLVLTEPVFGFLFLVVDLELVLDTRSSPLVSVLEKSSK
uniref:Uncharacterized protein n=1 Tax=Cacopsylla melanoneura TaxID=428564 RepID=A0A8D8PQ00_9HEMI